MNREQFKAINRLKPAMILRNRDVGPDIPRGKVELITLDADGTRVRTFTALPRVAYRYARLHGLRAISPAEYLRVAS